MAGEILRGAGESLLEFCIPLPDLAMPTKEPLELLDCSSGDKVTLGLGAFADVVTCLSRFQQY